jgi:hypothetical protein
MAWSFLMRGEVEYAVRPHSSSCNLFNEIVKFLAVLMSMGRVYGPVRLSMSDFRTVKKTDRSSNTLRRSCPRPSPLTPGE